MCYRQPLHQFNTTSVTRPTQLYLLPIQCIITTDCHNVGDLIQGSDKVSRVLVGRITYPEETPCGDAGGVVRGWDERLLKITEEKHACRSSLQPLPPLVALLCSCVFNSLNSVVLLVFTPYTRTVWLDLLIFNVVNSTKNLTRLIKQILNVPKSPTSLKTADC